MADFTFGQAPNVGAENASNGESITLQLDYWTVTVAANALLLNDVSGNGTPTTQALFNKIVQVISERGQPVILGTPTFAAGITTINFAIDHHLSWNTNIGTAPVYGLGGAGAATDGGAAALVAKLVADCVNYTNAAFTATVRYSL